MQKVRYFLYCAVQYKTVKASLIWFYIRINFMGSMYIKPIKNLHSASIWLLQAPSVVTSFYAIWENIKGWLRNQYGAF